MASVINRTTLEYLDSVNTPDYTEVNSISIERNNIKYLDVSKISEKKKNYTLCTDPDVKIKGIGAEIDKKRAKIVFSKGEYYSEEQEKIIDEFLSQDKINRKYQRDLIFKDFWLKKEKKRKIIIF